MKSKTINVLLVENEEAHAELVRRSFDCYPEKFQLNVVGTISGARMILTESPPDIVIAELRLPDGDSTELLPGRIRQAEFPFVVITSNGDEHAAVRVMKMGALDYIPKTEEVLATMPQIVERSLREWVNIVESTQVEDSLRESEERFRALLLNLEAGIVVHGPDTSIVMNNPRASELLGLSNDQMRGKEAIDPAWKFVDEDNTPLLLEDYPVNKILAGKKPIQNQILGITKPGSDIVWTTVNGFPVFDNTGAFSEIVISFIDITERKQAEKEQENLQAQLVQAQKMESVGRLAGGVAHDFNNMLGVILGHAELIMEEMDPALPIYAELEAIRIAARRSADLTRQLLGFARKQTVAPKVLNLNQTLEGMLQMLRRLIGENIDLVWLPGKDLGSIKIDPSQIDQMLANLCVNARDAIADVGKVTIETGTAVFDEDYCSDHVGFVPGEFVKLVVSDDGSGMDQETLAQVFEPFFTTKELGKGTGLGLATIYGIAKQNNGFVNVYSELGHGTTFRIYLPRYFGKTEQILVKGPAMPAARGHETILLVEDEPAILEFGTKMLERLGYTVMAAGTPGEAIRMAGIYADQIHLLITDVVMPEMNGRDLAKNLLSSNPKLKSLFMSGYTANVIAHHGVLDEGVHFIQKPFSKKELGDKVHEIMERE